MDISQMSEEARCFAEHLCLRGPFNLVGGHSADVVKNLL